jgi:RNA polymerase sigma factor (sigma-70 family)
MTTATPVQQDGAFGSALSVADEVLEQLCRHHRLRWQDAEDFGSYARLRLLDNDYEVLRRFAGRSSLRTFLAVVLQRLLLDFRSEVWGKYRPSAPAKRLGPVALRLERLICRDGLTTEEAVANVLIDLGAEVSRGELLELAERLPRRPPRRFEEVRDVPVDGGVEDHLLDRERSTAALLAKSALGGALPLLQAEDRLILKMRFASGLSVRQIAAALRLPSRPLYARIEKSLNRLRREVERRGLSREQAMSLLGWKGCDMKVDFLAPPENGSSRLPRISEIPPAVPIPEG